MIVEEHQENSGNGDLVSTLERVKRIAVIARSMATVVTDAKHRRELELTQDLTPKEVVEVCEVVR